MTIVEEAVSRDRKTSLWREEKISLAVCEQQATLRNATTTPLLFL